jgi:hypothetical protein
MSYKTIRTFTRPNATIPFALFNQTITDYTNANYDQTGKRTSFSVELSGDQLQQTATSVWLDEATYNEFMADPTIVEMSNSITAYNNSVGISCNWNNSEV